MGVLKEKGKAAGEGGRGKGGVREGGRGQGRGEGGREGRERVRKDKEGDEGKGMEQVGGR